MVYGAFARPPLPSASSFQLTSDSCFQVVEPLALGLAQQQMEVEQVVSYERWTHAGFRQFGRQTPDLHADTATDQEVNDAPAGFFGNTLATVRTTEVVRTTFVVGTDHDHEVVGRQLNIATTRAVGSDSRGWGHVKTSGLESEGAGHTSLSLRVSILERHTKDNDIAAIENQLLMVL